MTYTKLFMVTNHQFMEANINVKDFMDTVEPKTEEWEEIKAFEHWTTGHTRGDLAVLAIRFQDRQEHPDDWYRFDDCNCGFSWYPREGAMNRMYEIYKKLK